MARKNKLDKKDNSLLNEEEGKGKLSTILIAILIIFVWLLFFAALIKFDVGGFGSSVMRPLFKNVPVINKILPDATTEEAVSGDYPYKSLADAISYIKELEVEIQKDKDTIKTDKEKIAELEGEVKRLKEFENNQLALQKEKEEFYNEVVFGDKALSYDEYKKYYESIDAENAEKLYKEVIAQYLQDKKYDELALAYTSMKPKKAAAALYEMTGNLETVVAILEKMETGPRALILDALSDLDPIFCGKITVMLAP